jgi:hypothetical protein
MYDIFIHQTLNYENVSLDILLEVEIGWVPRAGERLALSDDMGGKITEVSHSLILGAKINLQLESVAIQETLRGDSLEYRISTNDSLELVTAYKSGAADEEKFVVFRKDRREFDVLDFNQKFCNEAKRGWF